MRQIISAFSILMATLGLVAFSVGALAANQSKATKRQAPAKFEASASLQQLMIGTLYAEANVVFAAQGDLSTFKPGPDAATSPNLLTSAYPGWQAVQNAAISLQDAANLLLVPGRLCSNGKPVPLNRPDWVPFVQALRKTAAESYKAAMAKSQDDMVTATGDLNDACGACHAAYRDKYPNSGGKKVCMP